MAAPYDRPYANFWLVFFFRTKMQPCPKHSMLCTYLENWFGRTSLLSSTVISQNNLERITTWTAKNCEAHPTTHRVHTHTHPTTHKHHVPLLEAQLGRVPGYPNGRIHWSKRKYELVAILIAFVGSNDDTRGALLLSSRSTTTSSALTIFLTAHVL